MPALTITLLEPGVTLQTLGALPDMLDANDPAPAREQLDRGYQRGFRSADDVPGRLRKCGCETRESSFSKPRSLRSSH
jgi:hypothetical protein